MLTEQTYTSRCGQPLVSFIVPCYNLPADMLHACLQSILALSLRSCEREIIVVDDGSEPPVLQALASYVDEIIYVRQPNGGISSARNLGLRMATADYVQFVDGDDYLLRPGYEHVLDKVRFGHPDMVLFDFTSQEGELEEYTDEPPMSGRELMLNSNIHGTACCYLLRKNILGNLRFTPGIDYGEDEEFTAQLLLRTDSLVRTTAKAYFYRMRADSAIHKSSMRKKIKRLNDGLTVISRLYTFSATLPPDERPALRRRIHQLTMDYIYNVILLTQNRHYLERKLKVLRNMGLYPLPKYDYTRKYVWFRRLANTSLGLSMLMRAIPLLKKKR